MLERSIDEQVMKSESSECAGAMEGLMERFVMQIGTDASDGEC